jgi:hypothetical protein
LHHNLNVFWDVAFVCEYYAVPSGKNIFVLRSKQKLLCNAYEAGAVFAFEYPSVPYSI